MQTVVIFNNFDDGVLTCAIVDGDFSHLHEKYINSCDVSDEEQDEIDALAKKISKDNGVDEWRVDRLPAFPNDEFYSAVRGGAKVIVTGCLP